MTETRAVPTVEEAWDAYDHEVEKRALNGGSPEPMEVARAFVVAAVRAEEAGRVTALVAALGEACIDLGAYEGQHGMSVPIQVASRRVLRMLRAARAEYERHASTGGQG